MSNYNPLSSPNSSTLSGVGRLQPGMYGFGIFVDVNVKWLLLMFYLPFNMSPSLNSHCLNRCVIIWHVYIAAMALSSAVSPISSPHLSPQGSPLINHRSTPPVVDPTLASNGHSHTPPNRLVQVTNIQLCQQADGLACYIYYILCSWNLTSLDKLFILPSYYNVNRGGPKMHFRRKKHIYEYCTVGPNSLIVTEMAKENYVIK